ncbi:MAG: GAF domain-containing protein [Chloroflexota bacterium]|nr:GAF domain-containing protein [Chloroflexota bacterium]
MNLRTRLAERWEWLVAVQVLDEEESRLGRLFNTLMVIGIGIVIALALVFLLMPRFELIPRNVSWIAAAFPLAFVPISAFCLACARRGYVRPMVPLYVWVNLLGIALAVFVFDGIRSPAWLLYIWTITIAGTLLAPAYALGMTGGVVAYFFLLLILSRLGLYTPPLTIGGLAGREFANIAFRMIMLISTVGILTYLNVRSLREALNRLRTTTEKLKGRTVELKAANEQLQSQVAERIRAEETLAKALRERENIMETVPDIIYMLDLDGNLVSWNRKAEAITGFSAEELAGRLVLELMPTADRAVFAEVIGRGIEQGLAEAEISISRKDGTAVPYHWTAALLRDEQGDPIGITGIGRDISEIKQAEEEIKRRSEELEALREISLSISAQLDLDELLQSIVEWGCRLLEVSVGVVHLLDETNGDLQLAVSHGLPGSSTGMHIQPGEGLVGQVLESGAPMVIDNYRYWEGCLPCLEAESLTAVIGVPLKRGPHTFGVLSFAEMTQARDFDEHDVWLATLFANQAAIAIENARLYEEQQRRLYDLSLLHEVSARVSASLDPQKVLERIVQGTVEAVGADAASINLLIAPGKAQMVTSVGLSERFEWHTDVRPAGTTMTVIRTGEPLMIPDVAQRPEMVKPLVLEEGIQSFIVLPLPGREGVIGAMFVFYHRSHQFSDDEVRLLTTIANQAATALENARLFAETSRRVRELQLLHGVGLAAASGVRLEETLQAAAEALAAELKGNNVALMLLDSESDTLRMAASVGYPPDVSNGLRLRLGEGVTGWVAQQGEPLLVPDVRLAPSYYEAASNTRSELCVPLVVGEEVIGVLNVESYQVDAFTPGDQRLLSTLASNLAVLVERARLFEDIEAARVELQERAQALEEANVRLQELDRLKSEFLANMSHELRTPLNSVIGFSEVLIDGLAGEVTSGQKDCLENIRSSGKHLLELINDILDLSKIEAGRVELKSATFDVAELLVEVQATIAPLVEKKSQILEIEQADGLPSLTADRFRVKQILLNLLSNAHKFTPIEGQIRLSCYLADRTAMLFSVSDTGVGIKPEDQKIIFDEFRQADGSAEREVTGTGLGLAISKRLVEMHGGRIWVESEYGHGATFSLLFPLVGSPAVEPKMAGKTERPSGSRTVLVVEDDRQLSDLLAFYLRQEGYVPVQHYNGLGVLDRVCELKPALITLDIMLPGRDGWEVLRALKADSLTKDIPVLVISVLKESKLTLSLGAVDCLVKPIQRGNLRKALDRLTVPESPGLGDQKDDRSQDMRRRI